jgi:hypothetical protein
MRWAVALGLLVGCGGGGAGIDGGGGGDGGHGADAMIVDDAGPSCGTTWARVATPATDLALMDPAPLNGDRTFRVAATVTLGPCFDLAMPVIDIDAGGHQVDLGLFAWQPLGADCSDVARSIERPIALLLGEGTWTLHADSQTLMVTVASPPDRACNTAIACQMDCDCENGMKCLGGNGLAGEFTQCAVPCELDRDCGGAGDCVTVADGLASACEGADECGDGRPCAGGYDCVTGACTPQTQLGQGSRVTCACDADCAPPLRCVESDYAGRDRRCEIACPTAGPWCNGPHFCGTADQDVADLAPADSVCVYAGE